MICFVGSDSGAAPKIKCGYTEIAPQKYNFKLNLGITVTDPKKSPYYSFYFYIYSPTLFKTCHTLKVMDDTRQLFRQAGRITFSPLIISGIKK